MDKVHIFLGNRIALQRGYAILVTIVLGVTLTGWRQIAPALGQLFSLVGWLFIGVGVLGRIWSGSYISGSKNARLVVSGPYSICRNPLYLFSFFGGIGVMLISQTLILPIQFALLFGIYYRQLIEREEAVMSTLHGAAFEAYCARVPRFWPKFSLYSEPVEYMVSAALLRKGLADAIWIIIGGALIDFVEEMHELGHLPSMLNLF